MKATSVDIDAENHIMHIFINDDYSMNPNVKLNMLG